MDISHVMTRRPVILHDCATALDAAEKMKGLGCGFLPIGDEKNIKGVITDRDILVRAAAKNKDLSQIPITDIMSRNPVFCEEGDILQRALYMMNKHKIRRVLVQDKNKYLCGVISLEDILCRISDPVSLSDLLYKAGYELLEEEFV